MWPLSSCSTWTAEQLSDFLDQARQPVRLACQHPDGFPRIVSLWYRREQHTLWCVTHRNAQLLRWLAYSPRVGFEIATNTMPYHGVRGYGQVERHETLGGIQLEQLLERYQIPDDSHLGRWLRSRADDEIALAIQPQQITSWDYRQRMQDLPSR